MATADIARLFLVPTWCARTWPGRPVRLVRLVRLLRELSPPRSEVDALLTLVLLQHSRRDTRTRPDVTLVVLADQDRTRWRHDKIAEAITLLHPLTGAPAAPYRSQALIAAGHAIAPTAAASWTS